MILKKLALTKFFMGKYFIIQEDFQLPPNKQLDCMTCSLPGEVKLIKFTVYKLPVCPSGSGQEPPVFTTLDHLKLRTSQFLSTYPPSGCKSSTLLLSQCPRSPRWEIIKFISCARHVFWFCLKVILFYNLNDIKFSSYFWITVFYMTVKTSHFKDFMKHIESKISKIKPCSLCGLS